MPIVIKIDCHPSGYGSSSLNRGGQDRKSQLNNVAIYFLLNTCHLENKHKVDSQLPLLLLWLHLQHFPPNGQMIMHGRFACLARCHAIQEK